ncbi:MULTISPECIES: prenyltransferase [Metallosphaera]|uniref:prenyltransferase n=1 Tax=Metallosphaera TaxID=41980 RepID=UPI001F05D651|nr:prenyltransferase [Metallosphaera sedula]MCH1771549.1 prenyltransferase [Metallosphaera sedula]
MVSTVELNRSRNDGPSLTMAFEVSMRGFITSSKKIFMVSRPWSFVMPAICTSFGFSLGYYMFRTFNPLFYVAVLLGTVLLNASVNVLNDYFDYVQEIDTRENTGYRLHPIIHGVMSERGTLILGIALGVMGLSLAIYLTLYRPLALPLGLLGVLLLYMYNGPPFNLKHRALGEVLVFITYDLIVLGSYYVSTGMISSVGVLDGAPLALPIAGVLLVNNLRDIESDKRKGGKTLAILFPNFSRRLYLFSMLSPYVIIVILVMARLLPPTGLISVLTSLVVAKRSLKISRELPPDSPAETSQIFMLFGTLYVLSTLIGNWV